MSDARGPKDDHSQPHGAATQLSEERKQARALSEAAREMRAQAHQAMETTRQLSKHNEAIVQHMQAWRERQAELGGLPSPTAPRTALKILLIEDASADVELFRYALKECGLGCEVKVLMQGSEVEAFVRQAATAAPLFQPQLIIADCLIPGMETEDILAALRTVPAYQRIPVFLFSTLAEAEGHRRSVQCGATAFVPKPGNLQAFVEEVATMVRRSSGGQCGRDASKPAVNSWTVRTFCIQLVSTRAQSVSRSEGGKVRWCGAKRGVGRLRVQLGPLHGHRLRPGPSHSTHGVNIDAHVLLCLPVKR